MAGIFPLGQIVIKPQVASLMVMLKINPRVFFSGTSPATGVTPAMSRSGLTTRHYGRERGRILSTPDEQASEWQLQEAVSGEVGSGAVPSACPKGC